MTFKELEKKILNSLEQAKKTGTASNYVIIAYDRKTISEKDGMQFADWKKVSIAASTRNQPSTSKKYDSKFTENLVASGCLLLPFETEKNKAYTFDELAKLPQNAKSFKVVWAPEMLKEESE